MHADCEAVMLDIGSFKTRTCGGVGRRSFLRLAASVPLAFGVSAKAAVSAEPESRELEASETAARKPAARSVLFVFLWGAPSHLDTIDPKPDASVDYRGPFGTIATRTPGLRFTELLPML